MPIFSQNRLYIEVLPNISVLNLFYTTIELLFKVINF